MRKLFQYYILNEAGHYYYVSNRQVMTSIEKRPLVYDLINWHEADLSVVRNLEYLGVFFSITSPLSLVKDGATIIRHIYTTGGAIEAVAKLHVEILDSTTQLYKTLTSGDLDFSQYHNERLYVTLEVQESGLYDLFRARATTPFEIMVPTSGPAAVSAYMDGITLQADYVYSTISRTENYTSTQLFGIQMVGVNKDGAYSIGEQKNQEYMVMGNPLSFPSWSIDSKEHNNYAFKADQAAEVSLNIYQEIQYDNPASNSTNFFLETRVYVCRSDFGSPYNKFVVFSDATTPLAPGGPTRRILINKTTPTFHVDAGDRVYYMLYISGPGSSGGAAYSNVLFFGQQRISILGNFKLFESAAPGIRLLDLWKSMITQMSGGKYSGASKALSNPNRMIQDVAPYHIVASCGDALRNLPGAKIKTTPADFKAAIMGTLGFGVGIEKDAAGGETAVIEPIEYFFDNSVVTLDLGEVEMPVEEPDLESIFNLLKVGSPKSEYDGLNGRTEFNNEMVFAMPITREKKERDLTTPYRTDMYGIEHLRANLANKRTQDAQTDNQTFLLELTNQPVTFRPYGAAATSTVTALRLARRQNDPGCSASGILFPSTAYNLGLSPKRNLLRNGRLISSVLHGQEAKKITYQTADKNPDLISNLGSGQVVERADIAVSSLPATLFLPHFFQFEHPAPKNLAAILAARPYGRINFSVRIHGQLVQLGGFIDQIDIKPSSKAATTWKLLCCPDVDLARLVH